MTVLHIIEQCVVYPTKLLTRQKVRLYHRQTHRNHFQSHNLPQGTTSYC